MIWLLYDYSIFKVLDSDSLHAEGISDILVIYSLHIL